MICIVCSVTTYAQRAESAEIEKERYRPVENFSLEEIRKIVYETPGFYINIGTHLSHDVPAIRDSVSMKQEATTPALLIDSLFYENLRLPPKDELQELLLKRFSYLIMQDSWTQRRVIEIIDLLEEVKPGIAAEEYHRILRKNYPSLIERNFRNLNDVTRTLLEPYRIVGDVLANRLAYNRACPYNHRLRPKAKPYFDRLGIKTEPSWYDHGIRRVRFVEIVDTVVTRVKDSDLKK